MTYKLEKLLMRKSQSFVILAETIIYYIYCNHDCTLIALTVKI